VLYLHKQIRHRATNPNHMRSLKVEFNEDEINLLINKIVDESSNNDKCYEPRGDEFTIRFNDELHLNVKVLINDECNSRYASTDIQLITCEGFYKVESNINFLVEDRVNKALIAKFYKTYDNEPF